MKALWKGAISFGLVTIPVSLYPATRREELNFRLLRKSDQSPVNYKRIAEADGKEVPWDQNVKGYEYEKGKFVIIKDEDFARVDVEATQTVNYQFRLSGRSRSASFLQALLSRSWERWRLSICASSRCFSRVRQDRHRHGCDWDTPRGNRGGGWNGRSHDFLVVEPVISKSSGTRR
jgi:hypothetical protein